MPPSRRRGLVKPAAASPWWQTKYAPRRNTQQSTEEIEKLIGTLQNGAQSASQLMRDNQQLSDSTVELTRRAGDALSVIARTVSTIQSMNQQIAAAAEQQSAVAEEINRSVVSVRDISLQTATASDETARASTELASWATRSSSRSAASASDCQAQGHVALRRRSNQRLVQCPLDLA